MPKTKSKPVPSTVGQELIEGFTEFLEVLRSGQPLESRFIVRDYPDAAPSKPLDVRALREDALKVGPEEFARFLGVTARTLKTWEDGTRSAGPVARRFLEEIAADPKRWRARIKKSNSAAVRG